MRKKIIEIINTLGLNIEDFIIGCGAKSSLSIIHYKIRTQTRILRHGRGRLFIRFGKKPKVLFNCEALENWGSGSNSCIWLCWCPRNYGGFGAFHPVENIRNGWEDTRSIPHPFLLYENDILKCKFVAYAYLEHTVLRFFSRNKIVQDRPSPFIRENIW